MMFVFDQRTDGQTHTHTDLAKSSEEGTHFLWNPNKGNRMSKLLWNRPTRSTGHSLRNSPGRCVRASWTMHHIM